MAAEPLVTISDSLWLKWVAAFAMQTNKGIREALYEEWPLLMRKVMDFTPPFKTKASVNSTGGSNAASDLSVGRAAVAFDIYKVMRPFNPEPRTKGLERIIRNQDIDAYNIMAKRAKSGPMVGTTAVHFGEYLHQGARDRRGRVNGRDRQQVVLGSDVALLNAYVKKVQSYVGTAKAGWWPALALVGGNAPSYVTRHGTEHGEVIDDHANENDPSITAINRTAWAVRKDEGERILADAKASRIVSIVAKIKNQIRMADQAAKTA